MKRTEDQIQKAIDKIEAEIASLPAENAFGDSNDEPLQDLQEWLAALKLAKAGNPPGNEVVATWLDGRWSEIQDYCS